MLSTIAAILGLASHSADAVTAPPPSKFDEPDAAREGRLAAEAAIEEAIRSGEIPGAVWIVGRGDEVLHRAAYGARALEPAREPMTLDTVFDLASLTKVVATATSVMRLVDGGRVELDAPVARYLPEFGANGKADITVRHLLLHQGGLIPDNALADYEDGPELALERIDALAPRAAPGTTFTYTDVGYIVLGELVRAVDGRPLDAYSAEEVFAPLGMRETCFRPGEELRARCAPTERRGERWMRGEVHDPRAHLLGGVAGHAGLFATADDVARWCRAILAGGALGEARVLSEEAVRAMTEAAWLPDRTGGRALGFDVDTGYSSPRGNVFPRGSSLGHTGFTGTCFWLDPETRGYYVLLTNRVHPDGQGKVNDLRRRVADGAAAMLRPAAPRSGVRTGADVLEAEDCARLAGRRVGLITNVTGRTRGGMRTIDLLHRSPNVELARIFSPEHGLFAVREGGVGDSVDEATGLPVMSLYGDTRKPTARMLEGLDAVVFDVQDVGVRFYTYPSTMGLAMEACTEAGIAMIVLDRPNPITGERVAGPLIDADRLSFIGWRPLPVVHGMTVGELARMFRAEWGGIDCELEVVPLEGWSRAMWWEDTGLTWVPPSPNLRNPTQAVLYPCIGLLEGANVSVGRGTDEPFERFGAPWIDGRRLAAALSAARLPGLAFTPLEFTPEAAKHAGEACGGVHVTLLDRAAFRPVEAGLAIAWHLNREFGASFDLAAADDRLQSRETWRAMVTAPDWRTLAASWRAAEDAFRARREPYLLYR